MDRYARLQPLTRSSERSVESSFKALASALRGSREEGILQFRLVGGKERRYRLKMTKTSCSFDTRISKSFDLEIVTRAQTWHEIARGKLSPIEAFVRGKLRVRGDAELGKRLVTELTEDDGVVDIC